MKSKDQILLEEAYEQVSGSKHKKIDKDEKGVYLLVKGPSGEFVPSRIGFNRYDEQGNFLRKDADLEEGQFIKDSQNKYSEVKASDEGFEVVPDFQPSAEVLKHVSAERTKGIEADKEKAMKHFFPKK
jgi:hypothetical protein